MVRKNDNRTAVLRSETSHTCGLSCLGPLTFHPVAVGDKIRLSREGRLAERTAATFKNGLVFSSRPVRIQERICLRIEKELLNWEGAMRVGFTNVPPSDRSLPLPPMAIPNITKVQGNWAAALHESHCQVGSELEFWLTHGGHVKMRSTNFKQQQLLGGVDLSRPLWAMIDIYGQTCAVSLLGSKKKQGCITRRSCPAPGYLHSPDAHSHNSLTPLSRLHGNGDEWISRLDMEVPAAEGSVTRCVVCMEEQSKITLPCGHKCLCGACALKVIHQFGTCPLCRHEISASSV
ncbi:E3 ubiquitin-protein ligase NEURL3 [Pungitius pungitius]|uniref:E3 ubiquitin-protein ligase NEURL3 n=1 Tax=Pungitius pungitius TaxID=134920 RepID=UPI002E0DC5CB